MKPKVKILIDGSWFAKNRGTLSRKLAREVIVNFGSLETLLLAQAAERLGLKEGYESGGSTYFASAPSNYDPKDEPVVKKQLAFYKVLENVFHFTVKIFPINFQKNRVLRADRDPSFTPGEKFVDVAVASAVLDNDADVIILVAGDKDYLPALAAARRHGKKIVLASIKGSCAYLYQQGEQLDARVIWIDKFVAAIEHKWTYTCSASHHPAALPRSFATPIKQASRNDCLCPLCASLAKTLSLKARAAAAVAQPVSVPAAAPAGPATRTAPAKAWGFITSVADHHRACFLHVSDTAIGIAWNSINMFSIGAESAAYKAGKGVRIRPAFGV